MTHSERLALIYKPFPVVCYVGQSYPWAGTIVADSFFGEKDRPRGKHGDGFGNADEIDTFNARGEYDGWYAQAVERSVRR